MERNQIKLIRLSDEEPLSIPPKGFIQDSENLILEPRMPKVTSESFRKVRTAKDYRRST
jgi:hypothetical protein